MGQLRIVARKLWPFSAIRLLQLDSGQHIRDIISAVLRSGKRNYPSFD